MGEPSRDPLFQRPKAVFPDEFMKGVGMSVWQNSSDGPDPAPSNWHHYASKKKDFFGQSEYRSAWEHSNNFWELYEDDIKLAATTLGTNSFRFSFEWARIEPKGPGKVDQAAVDRCGRSEESVL